MTYHDPGLSRQVHNRPDIGMTVEQAAARLAMYLPRMAAGKVKARHAAALLRRVANWLDPKTKEANR
ncbi:MAG: hypothetical protein AAFY08_12990 [Planctomycetota bacterium]